MDMELISAASGPRVRGCLHAPRYFGPYPVVRVYLELCEISGNQSRLHIHTVGELGTKAKAGCSIDGRQFSIYETKAMQKMANVYLYAEGLDFPD